MEDKVWYIRDYEFSDGELMHSTDSWKLHYCRKECIRKARKMAGCSGAALIDSYGNIEVIKKDGEMLV